MKVTGWIILPKKFTKKDVLFAMSEPAWYSNKRDANDSVFEGEQVVKFTVEVARGTRQAKA